MQSRLYMHTNWLQCLCVLFFHSSFWENLFYVFVSICNSFSVCLSFKPPPLQNCKSNDSGRKTFRFITFARLLLQLSFTIVCMFFIYCEGKCWVCQFSRKLCVCAKSYFFVCAVIVFLFDLLFAFYRAFSSLTGGAAGPEPIGDRSNWTVLMKLMKWYMRQLKKTKNDNICVCSPITCKYAKQKLTAKQQKWCYFFCKSSHNFVACSTITICIVLARARRIDKRPAGEKPEEHRKTHVFVSD